MSRSFINTSTQNFLGNIPQSVRHTLKHRVRTMTLGDDSSGVIYGII